MQTMLQVTFGLFLVNLGLAHRRVLNQRRHRVHLLLNALGNRIVHAHDMHLPVDTRGVGRALGPDKRQDGTLVAPSGKHAKEGIVLDVAVLVDIGVNVIHHAVNLVVEQGVGCKRRRLNLSIGQQLELVGRRRVQHRHLDRARTLIGLVDGKVERELRKAVAPLESTLERGRDGIHRNALGQIGGVQASHHAVANLHAHNQHQNADNNGHGRPCNGMAHLRARRVVLGQRVDMFCLARAILAAKLRQRRLVAALGGSLFFAHALGALFGKRRIQNAGCVDLGE